MTDLIPTGLSDGPAPGVPTGPPCRYCGSTPAAMAVFKRHTGMVLVRKTETFPGPFCRDCGLSWFRATTAHTLAAGWIGLISFFVMPFGVIGNILNRRKIAGLAAPVPPAGYRPMDPGRPLLLRVQSALVLIPVALVVLLIVSPDPDAPESQVGNCVAVASVENTASDSSEAEFVECDSAHDAVVTAVVDSEDDCPAGTMGTLTRETSTGRDLNQGKVLCLGSP